MDDLKFERIEEVIYQKNRFNKDNNSGYGISVCSRVPWEMQNGIFQMGHIAQKHMEYLAASKLEPFIYKGMAAGYLALENIVDTSGIFLSYLERTPKDLGIEEADIAEHTLEGYSRRVEDILEEFETYLGENFSTAQTVLESVKHSLPTLYDMTKSLAEGKTDQFMGDLGELDFPHKLGEVFTDAMYKHIFSTLVTIYGAAEYEVSYGLEGHA